MSLFLYRKRSLILSLTKNIKCSMSSSSLPNVKDDDEFSKLELLPQKMKFEKKKSFKIKVSSPRTNEMRTDQDWSNVWPVARTFHPAVVPLPLRQGYTKEKVAPPNKFANAELMKIPNFLHLTPPAVKKHCNALKKFCTKWPSELNTDEECRKYFPVEIITSDYCYSGPSIRDPLARIVSLKVKLSSLHLDNHAKDKLLRLLQDRYDPKTDMIIITADRCPTKKQNLEYVEYLLTAVFHESWCTESWESEKSEVDMEYYGWDQSKNCKNVVEWYKWPEPAVDLDYEAIPCITEYKIAVLDLYNKGEDQYAVNKYKEAVKNVLNLKYNN